MRYISMFSGIEAATRAFHPLGWEPICFAEIEAFPSAVLAHHYPNTPNVGNMTAHDWSAYRGRCDLVVGGPPCQAFSVAGLRKSLEDDRGNLSLAYMRAIHAIDPIWCITENVPGWLSTKDNAFGCFLAGLVGEDAPLIPPGGRWTDSGVVDGPTRTAAWRILDAQYFGVAQRRRRVFVLSSRGSGNWACAAALFPIGYSLQGHSAPRRQARESSAAGTAFGLIGNGEYADKPASLRAKGGDCGGGSEHLIAKSLNALPSRSDWETETFVTGTLNANGKAAGSATQQDAESGMLVTHALTANGFDASEDGTGRGTPLVPVCFNSREDLCVTGDVSGSLGSSSPQAQAVAFSCKDFGADSGDISPTLRAMGFTGSHANAGGQVAVAFAQNSRDELRHIGGDGQVSGALSAEPGMKQQTYLNLSAGIRRLTPRECERLQGFPDDFTAVPYRGKIAADGNRYKALGNSMAVPVMAWIGRRIEMVRACLPSPSPVGE